METTTLNINPLTAGSKVHISGYSDELWIQDYHVNVSTTGIIIDTPKPKNKKVLVCLDEIDGDHDVTTMVRKSKLLK